MFDHDLAALYGVPTKSLNLAVRRNPIRFPEDFMFQLSFQEMANLRFQFETSRWGGRHGQRYLHGSAARDQRGMTAINLLHLGYANAPLLHGRRCSNSRLFFFLTGGFV